jgi:hypothetical protein
MSMYEMLVDKVSKMSEDQRIVEGYQNFYWYITNYANNYDIAQIDWEEMVDFKWCFPEGLEEHLNQANFSNYRDIQVFLIVNFPYQICLK